MSMHQRVIKKKFILKIKSVNFDPGWGGGGGGGGGGVLHLKSKCMFSLYLHLVIVEQLQALNLYNICPVRVCGYFRQHLPVKGCQTGS